MQQNQFNAPAPKPDDADKEYERNVFASLRQASITPDYNNTCLVFSDLENFVGSINWDKHKNEIDNSITPFIDKMRLVLYGSDDDQSAFKIRLKFDVDVIRKGPEITLKNAPIILNKLRDAVIMVKAWAHEEIMAKDITELEQLKVEKELGLE